MFEASPTTPRRPPPGRRRILLRRGVAAAVATVAVAGVVLLALSLLGGSEAERVAERFGAAWAEEDYGEMYGLLDAEAQAEITEEDFAAAYQEAAATATTTAIAPGEAREEAGEVLLPLTISTAVFGPITGGVSFGVAEERIDWAPELLFPGLREGEELSRRTRAPRRADLLARDGTVLAGGDPGERSSELGLDATAVTGTIDTPPNPEEADALYARGFPRDGLVGLGGLERIFERELAGTPGGVLLAGDREIARSEPRPAEPVRTTIDPGVQQAAVLALSQLGGIAAIDVATGELRALAGIAATGPQPPGSTFKIVTTTAALEAGLVEPSTEFPVETAAVIDGVKLRNAHRAACGGSFVNSFAQSCNSVFAPLGVRVGAERLVETAERYGVNEPPPIPGTDRSTMPQPDEFESDLELGATAIGQGELLMTPLRLAAVSETIANDGRLIEPTLDPAARPERRRVTSRNVADTIEDLMVGVVTSGTGTSAAIPGVEVAGKTGTAELGPGLKDHAWFTAFAPAEKRPELAIAVLIANGGAGGEVAAPAARSVLEAAL
jgi:penicillin-binding protein A